MTYDEARQAYIDMTPVWHNGIEYPYILARKIQRDKNGKHIMLLELMDKNDHSITVARVERVNLTPPNTTETGGTNHENE